MSLAGFGAVSALVLGGVIASPASAEETPPPAGGAALDATAQSLLNSDDAIKGVGTNSAGVVIVAQEGKQLKAETQQFIKDSGAQVKELKGEFTALASTDVVGGAGYSSEPKADGSVGLCSVGFSGYSPEGDPAVITAGHCADHGEGTTPTTKTLLTKPSLDEAGGSVDFTHPLGAFGFIQFGALPVDDPNYSDDAAKGSTGDEQATDIAVIDDINPDLSLKPVVTDWTTAGEDDLSKSTNPITDIAAPTEGMPITRSGRTSGEQTGEVVIPEIWVNVQSPDGGFSRYVKSFCTTAHSEGGDSGGSMYSGTSAVGVLSSGGTLSDGTEVSCGTALTEGLKFIDGYTVAFDLPEPVVTSPENGGKVEAGSDITGTAEGASTKVSVSTNGDKGTEYPVTDGAFSFKAPNEPGVYEYTLVAKDDGYNKSEPVTHKVEVVPAAPEAPAAPVIQAPADGSQTVDKPVTRIGGTGVAGATVKITEGAEGQAKVGQDGKWVIEGLNLSYGAHTVSVIQANENGTSEPASVSFTVAPSAPTILSPENGATFDEGDAPTQVSGEVTLPNAGNGVEAQANGPERVVTVSVDGEVVGEANATGGVWTVDLPAALAAGPHQIEAVQTVNGVTSTSHAIAINVNAAVPEPEPTQPPGPDPEPTQPPGPAAPDDPGNGGGHPDKPNGELPQTGADMATLIAPAALGLGSILVAAGLLIYARVRSLKEQQQ